MKFFFNYHKESSVQMRLSAKCILLTNRFASNVHIGSNCESLSPKNGDLPVS